MSGRRRYLDPVIARPVVRAMTGSMALMALGNLTALGCVIGWLRAVESSSATRSALAFFGAAVVMQLIAGMVALAAWAWSR